ncbi:hypothetical protein MUK42_18859 [Musa troglodytarum]|uniref:Uncharacterized protein n=1 Tax=Musa troglodytarum TaxID=320322 RepID=A0A9E7EV18_9LILI|nr:hypothetical protein MUK42_18859 [Musa troglodytarum]
MAALTLHSNGLLHNGDNIDELWLVLNVTPQRVMSIVRDSIGAIGSTMNSALYGITSSINRSLFTSLLWCGRPLE